MTNFSFQMRNVTTIVACLAVTIMFAACDNNNPGDDDGNGKDNPAVTADDAISVKALKGLWHTSGFIEDFYWSFDANGRFAYYISGYQPPQGSSLSWSSEAYFKGNYRVNGYTIEFYNVQYDGFFEYVSSFKYFPDQEKITSSKLQDTPLQNPEKVDNFSLMFEFKDASRLRIVIDRDELRDNYDWFFDYVGTRGNITIPTHNIPGSEWPKDKLPPDLPEYKGGRIMSTETSNQFYIRINIDGSTRENYIAYYESMIQAGWELYAYVSGDIEKFKQGDDFYNTSTFDKGSYQVSINYNLNELGVAEIIWWH